MENPDVVSVDAIVKALYETISGRAGEPRRWERERALFAPGGRLIPTRRLEGGGSAADVFDVEGYIESRTPFFAQNDFFEIEVARREVRFGAIAHVWSVYEGRDAPGGRLLRRGINSIQLFHDGARWWVLSVLWDNEGPGQPLPAEFAV